MKEKRAIESIERLGRPITIPTKEERCLKEFGKFYDLLMQNAPTGYAPWFFPLEKMGKDPAGKAIMNIDPESKGSWKHKSARLTKEQCMEHIRQGYNLGISARHDDSLILIDIDSKDFLDQAPKDTLTVVSRKRCGVHSFGWNKDGTAKINLPTDHGEIRSDDQYLVAAGSYVPFDMENEKDKKAFDSLPETARQDKDLGYYTIKTEMPPKPMTFDDLPDFFKQKNREDSENMARIKQAEERKEFVGTGGKYDNLFKLKVSDIVGQLPKSRVGHPLHESDTDANFSLSPDGSLAHCWRHLVSLNAVQYLCVEAEYASCVDAGTPHMGRGYSKIKGDKKALEVAYELAVKKKLIPEYVGEKKQNDFVAYDADDLCEMDLPPREWIVEDLVISPSIVIIGGNPSSGKSYVCDDMGICISNGVPWLGKFATKKTKVLICDLETNAYGCRKRIRQLKAGHNLTCRGKLFVKTSIPGEKNKKIWLDIPEDMGKLKKYIKENEIGMVVFDTGRKVHHFEENSGDEIAQLFTEILQPLRDELKLVIFYTMHYKKGQKGEFYDQKSTKLKGSREFQASADGIILINPITSKVGDKHILSGVEIEVDKMKDDGTCDAFRANVENFEDLSKFKLTWVGFIEEFLAQQKKLADDFMLYLNSKLMRLFTTKTANEWLVQQGTEEGDIENKRHQVFSYLKDSGQIEKAPLLGLNNQPVVDKRGKIKQARSDGSPLYKIISKIEPESEEE